MRKYEQAMQELGLTKVSAKLNEQIADFKEAESELAALKQRLEQEQDAAVKEEIQTDINEFISALEKADVELEKSIRLYVKKLAQLKQSKVGRPKKDAPPKKTPEEIEAERLAEEKAAEEASKSQKLNSLIAELNEIKSRKIYRANPAYRRQKA